VGSTTRNTPFSQTSIGASTGAEVVSGAVHARSAMMPPTIPMTSERVSSVAEVRALLAAAR
jgi:hypothetical protein